MTEGSRTRAAAGSAPLVLALDAAGAWRLWRLVVLGSVALGVIGLVVAVLQWVLPDGLPGAGVFDLGSDTSVPTWWAAVVLLVCAGLSAVVWRVERGAGSRYGRHWAGLVGAFVLMSVDEVARVHERVGDVAAGFLPDLDGAFYYTWVVVALPLVAVFCLSYARFVAALPARTRRCLVLGAVLFLGGALGMEMVNAAQDSAAGDAETLGYNLGTVLEEALEMAGVAVLLAGLLRQVGPGLTARVAVTDVDPPAGPRPQRP